MKTDLGLAGCCCCYCLDGFRHLVLMGDECSLFVDDEEVPEKEEGPKGMPGRPLLESESDCAAINQSWKRSSFSSSNGVGNWVVYLVCLHGRWSMELLLLSFIFMRNMRLRCSLRNSRCRSNARSESE
jgi:hypothetical protein